jgi:acetolactate decarboxylase
MGSIFFTQTIKNRNNSENLVRNFSSESYFHREGMLIAALQRPHGPIRGKDGDVITVSGRPAKVIEAEYLCPLLPDNPLETTDCFADAKTSNEELIGPSCASTNNVNSSSVRYRFQAALDEQNNLISYQLLAVDTNGRLSIPSVRWRAQIVNFLTFAEQSFLDKVSYVVGNDAGQFRLQLLDRASQKLNEGVTYSIDRIAREELNHVRKDTLDWYKETAKDFLYQYASVSAFQAGVYDGNVTLGELKKRGDFGLGTFNGVDGELVVNQGKFYRIHSSGTVSEVSDCDHTSLAFVKFFKVDLSFTIQTADITLEQLQKKIASLVTVDNLYAIRIKGTFSQLTVRASALAQKPYQPLEEHLTQNQVIFNLSNTTGVAVGFLVPASMEKVNIPGFHFHYIADDLKSGGHIFDFTANQLTVEIDKTKGCYLELNTMPIAEK